MFRASQKQFSVWTVIVCLALSVIALGASAKHSQFDCPSDATSSLTQTVKMDSSSQANAFLISSAPSTELLVMVDELPPLPLVPPFHHVVPASSPLLV